MDQLTMTLETYCEAWIREVHEVPTSWPVAGVRYSPDNQQSFKFKCSDKWSTPVGNAAIVLLLVVPECRLSVMGYG